MEDRRVLMQRTLMRASDKLVKALCKNLEQYNLSGPEYGIIRNLGEDTLTLSELSHRLIRVNSNTTAMIDNLEKKGLVERVRGQEDRRVVRVKLTDRGLAIRDQVLPAQNQYITDFLAPLNEVEVKLLQNLLAKIEDICELKQQSKSLES